MLHIRRSKRQTKRTALVFCEGIKDIPFLELLKTYYVDSTACRAKVRAGKGGGCPRVVSDAQKYVGSYNTRIVLVDNDRGEKEMEEARCEASSKTTLVPISPCFEALMLSILEPTVDHTVKNSNECKKLFHSKYISENKRDKISYYRKLFPLKVVEAARHKNTLLNQIIRSLESA